MIQQLRSWGDSPWKMLKMYTKAIGFHTALSFTYIDESTAAKTTQNTFNTHCTLVSSRTVSRLRTVSQMLATWRRMETGSSSSRGHSTRLGRHGKSSTTGIIPALSATYRSSQRENMIVHFMLCLRTDPEVLHPAREEHRDGTACTARWYLSLLGRVAVLVPAYLREREPPSPVGTVVHQGPTDGCDNAPRVPERVAPTLKMTLIVIMLIPGSVQVIDGIAGDTGSEKKESRSNFQLGIDSHYGSGGT